MIRLRPIVASGQTTVYWAPWASASLLCFPWARRISWNQSSGGADERMRGRAGIVGRRRLGHGVDEGDADDDAVGERRHA